MKKPQNVDNIKMGNFLYALRKERGISQTQLGLLLGVTNKAVSKWETGENQPEVAMLYQLADFYRLSVDEIVQGKRNEEKPSTGEQEDALAKRLAVLEKISKKARNGSISSIFSCSASCSFSSSMFSSLFPHLSAFRHPRS